MLSQLWRSAVYCGFLPASVSRFASLEQSEHPSSPRICEVFVCSDRHSPDLQWKRFFFKKRELFTFYCLRAPHYYTFNIVSYKANSLTVMHSLFRCYIELLVVTAETVKGLYTRWEFRTQAGQFCLQKNWWWN